MQAPPPLPTPDALAAGTLGAGDLLDEALQALRVRGALVHHSRLAGPWALHDDLGMPTYHVVLEGTARLRVGGDVVELGAGDLAVLPRGGAYSLHDARDTPAVPLRQFIARCERDARGVFHLAGAGTPTALVCGALDFDAPVAHPLLETLPPVLLVRHERHEQVAWLDATLNILACEAASGRPGAQTAIAHLSSVLFIQALRHHLAETPARRLGWLRAIQDPHVGPALRAVHADLAADWSVGALAAAAHLSRSAFAERFHALVGEPPMQYVTRWRMHAAARTLRTEAVPVAEAAERVGYASEAAFSRMFKRWLGQPPAAYRRAGG